MKHITGVGVGESRVQGMALMLELALVQNTSRIQHTDARANSSISAIRSPYYPFLEERAMLGVIDAAGFRAGALFIVMLCPRGPFHH